MIKRFQLTGGSLVPVESEDSPIQVYINPDTLERNTLQAMFNIDDHTLSSALDPDEVSRMELDPDHILLIWKRPINYSCKDAFSFDVASIGLLLFKERLVVIVTDDIELVGIGTRQTRTLRSPLDVMLRLLFSTIQHYLARLKVIKMIARELQQKINTSMENKHLIQMFNLSESLVFYINAINSNGVVLTRLRNHAKKGAFSPEIVAFIDDLIIENNQCYKQTEIYSTVFSGLMDARGNLVNNNMNTLLKNLTLINVRVLAAQPNREHWRNVRVQHDDTGIDWRISYSLFCVAMLLLGGITAIVLKRVNFGVNLAEAPEKKSGT